MFFSQDWRERIKTENPDAGFGESIHSISASTLVDIFLAGEVGKLLGAKWKELDEEEKKVCPPFLSHGLGLIHDLLSLILNKPHGIKHERRKRRLHMTYGYF